MRAAAESSSRLISFSRGTFSAASIFSALKVDQQRALIEDRVAVEEAAGAADLAAVDLDVVARPIVGIDAKPVQPRGRGFTDCLGEFRQRCDPERPAMEDELPAELAFVENRSRRRR